MSIKLKSTATAGRFNNLNSALLLEEGFGTIPDIHFNPEGFTIMLWIKPLSIINYHQFFDFGNGLGFDNILTQLVETTTSFQLYESPNGCLSQSLIQLNEWKHVTVVYSDDVLALYFDAIEQCSLNQSYSDVTRTKNFIGSSSFQPGPSANTIFDEMKIFNRSLTPKEIGEEMVKNK